jgi:hypothetical protein
VTTDRVVTRAPAPTSAPRRRTTASSRRAPIADGHGRGEQPLQANRALDVRGPWSKSRTTTSSPSTQRAPIVMRSRAAILQRGTQPRAGADPHVAGDVEARALADGDIGTEDERAPGGDVEPHARPTRTPRPARTRPRVRMRARNRRSTRPP